MLNRNTAMMQQLESRTLFSVSPAPAGVFNSTVQADRLQIQADLLQFKSDCLSYSATLLADVAAIKAAGIKSDPGVEPLARQFCTDDKNMVTQLKEDDLQEKSNVLKDESAIAAEQAQLLKDHGNPTKVAADKAQILADRIQLQSDMIAGLDARIAVRESFFTTITADAQAIVTQVDGDPSASVPLQADVQKWFTDKTDCLTTLLADLQKLDADRAQLVADLTAIQSMT
jgi:hypothetical protein